MLHIKVLDTNENYVTCPVQLFGTMKSIQKMNF
jgi:hypothetical protein